MEIHDVRNVSSKITNQDVQSSKKKHAHKDSSMVKNERFERSDALVISDEGKKALELKRYSQIGKSLPAVREDVINQVKERMSKGFYSAESVLDETAKRLLNSN